MRGPRGLPDLGRLLGNPGAALHAVLCAAGYNLRWLLRAIAREGLKALLRLSMWVTRLASDHARPPRSHGLKLNFARPTTDQGCIRPQQP